MPCECLFPPPRMKRVQLTLTLASCWASCARCCPACLAAHGMLPSIPLHTLFPCWDKFQGSCADCVCLRYLSPPPFPNPQLTLTLLSCWASFPRCWTSKRSGCACCSRSWWEHASESNGRCLHPIFHPSASCLYMPLSNHSGKVLRIIGIWLSCRSDVDRDMYQQGASFQSAYASGHARPWCWRFSLCFPTSPILQAHVAGSGCEPAQAAAAKGRSNQHAQPHQRLQVRLRFCGLVLVLGL
jgi:hypothetical protein